jgi:hypothetical protein
MIRSIRYEETIEVAEGKVSVSANNPDALRRILYAMREEVTAAIVRVEDDMAGITEHEDS